MLEVTKYLHENNIIHRDIQSRNILFNQNTNEVKLIDFAVARNHIENE